MNELKSCQDQCGVAPWKCAQGDGCPKRDHADTQHEVECVGAWLVALAIGVPCLVWVIATAVQR